MKLLFVMSAILFLGLAISTIIANLEATKAYKKIQDYMDEEEDKAKRIRRVGKLLSKNKL